MDNDSLMGPDSDGVRTQIGSVSLSLGPESLSTFDREELRAMISTAHKLGVKVAAHANTSAAIHDCLDLGVDSIEHGAGIFSNENEDVGLIQKLAAAKGRTKWVPTLAAYYKISQYSKAPGKFIWDRAKETFVKAVIEGGLDNVACGGDTGVFNHGENALELVLMRQLGAPWEKILSWAILGGWECIRGSEWDGEAGAERIRKLEETPGLSLDLDRGVPFGVIRRGWAADLVGIEGDMTGTPTEFERAVTEGVKVVIKAGKIVKQ